MTVVTRPPKSDPKPYTVLVVDDHEDILVSVSSFLEEKGLEVIIATSPLGVSSLVMRHKPSVIVLDAMMPALDGAALAKLLRSLPSSASDNIPIVFFSSMDEEQLYQIARGTERASYVLKSDGLGALYAAICRALGEPRA